MDTPQPLAEVRLLALDIDGTLTDGYLYWAGPEVGWTQRYAVRDGEAILRLVAAGLPVVPLSRNRTACARARMVGLGLEPRWVGVADKMAALSEIAAEFGVLPEHMAYVGDGAEDVPVLQAVGVGIAPADGHPAACAAADIVTEVPGGRGVAEAVAELWLRAHAG